MIAAFSVGDLDPYDIHIMESITSNFQSEWESGSMHIFPSLFPFDIIGDMQIDLSATIMELGAQNNSMSL